MNKLPSNISTSQERPPIVQIHGFTFTGKERDAETGFSYHGARYYDADLLTSWTAVDPLADKYSSLSPYNYCAWNPMRLMDQDGMELTASSDWYKDANGHAHWDANVHSQADLKNGEAYIGRTACMVAEGGDNVIYGDQYGQTHSSVSLPGVTITANRPPAKNQQGPAWVNDGSFGTALGTSMVGSAAKSSYSDYCPLDEKKFVKAASTTSKVMNYAGKLAGTAGVAYTGYRAWENGHKISTGEGIRIAIQAASVGTSFIPVYGTAVSLGLTAIDYFFGDAIEKIGSK